MRDSANQIILYPLQDEYQEVISQELTITGDPIIDTHTDYYGNEVGSFTYTEPHASLLINSRIWVHTKHRALPGNDIFPAQQWEDLKPLQLYGALY